MPRNWVDPSPVGLVQSIRNLSHWFSLCMASGSNAVCAQSSEMPSIRAHAVSTGPNWATASATFHHPSRAGATVLHVLQSRMHACSPGKPLWQPRHLHHSIRSVLRSPLGYLEWMSAQDWLCGHGRLLSVHNHQINDCIVFFTERRYALFWPGIVIFSTSSLSLIRDSAPTDTNWNTWRAKCANLKIDWGHNGANTLKLRLRLSTDERSAD